MKSATPIEASTPQLDPGRSARSAVLIAAGGLALFTAFMSAIYFAGWFRMEWAPVATTLGILVGLNLGLSRCTRLWAGHRWGAWIYEGVHAAAFTVILHHCGGLQMGIGFLVFAFLVIHTEMLRADATPFVTANVAALAYGALAVSELRGWVEPVAVLDAHLTAAETGVMVAFGFLSLNFLALYAHRSGHLLRNFASRLQDMVRERTSELHEKAEALERLNGELSRRVDEKVSELGRMRALKRYLPAPLVEEVMEGKLSVSGAHDRVRIAVLVLRFRVSGGDDVPEDTAASINAFLERTLAAAHARGGVVDRLTPAGVSILFGAPVQRPLGECAQAAVETAREVLGTVASVEAALGAEGVVARLDVSAGLATGVSTVGNFGSEDRLEYMAIGAVVEHAWELSCGGAGQLSVDETSRALVPAIADDATLAVRPGVVADLGSSALLPISADRSASRSGRRRAEEGPLSVGDHVDDRYEVLSVLGTGAMGVVYRVRHLELTCLRALKVIYPHLLSNPEAVRRLRCEAEALSRISHPNIVHFYDFAKDHNGERYLTMELVDGPTLAKMIAGRPMPLPQIRLIADQVLEALEAAHGEGIVHRDLKPANVIVSQGLGTPLTAKVADFGLARLLSGAESASHSGALGTPAYMSPEQCRGEHGDGRSDLYSFGVILFEMLTGRRPFAADRLEGWFGAHLNQPAPDPREFQSLPAAWAHLVLRALDKDPSSRFQDAGEMRRALLATCFDRNGEELPLKVRTETAPESAPPPPAERGTETVAPDQAPRSHGVHDAGAEGSSLHLPQPLHAKGLSSDLA